MQMRITSFKDKFGHFFMLPAGKFFLFEQCIDWGGKSRFQTWAPYRVQCSCLQCQHGGGDEDDVNDCGDNDGDVDGGDGELDQTQR